MRHNANKHSKHAWAAILLVFTVQTALANPVGPSVVNGQASFATAGNTLTVTNTPGAIINWQGFSIGANEVTRFAQQNASSAVLNRVVSSNPSSILGSLQSNGRVFLVNPSGIVFGQGATVDVAGLVATSLNLSNADFLAGRYNFTDMPGAQSVSNAGSLAAQGDGQIYLIAPDVENTGIITAPNGEILLAAGHSVDLVNSIEPNLRVSITAPAGDATNIGQLIAESGSLGLFGTVVRNSGTASADSATTQGGKIVFKASQRAEISGTVSATGTKGGDIQALGEQVGVTGSLDASGANGGGTVLVGGDYQGKNPEVQNATVTYFGTDASIKADATRNGDGGKVIVWADDTTRAHGGISARGGAQGGDGGFAEVSGKQHLYMTGYVDLRASKGRAGTLLLDPGTVNITVGANGAEALPDTFTDGYINNLLTTANLTIATSAASGANGAAEDIVFVGSPFIQFDQIAGKTLTLTAGRNITLAGTIGEGAAAGQLFLNVGQLGAGTLGGTATFNNVTTTVVGGAGNDTFDMSGISSNSSFSIDGNGGTDTLMVSDNAATITLADGSFAGTTSTTLANIETAIISGGAGNNAIGVGGFTGSVTVKATGGTDTVTGNGANTTLIGDNIANSWIITAANSGSLNASTSFSGVGSLAGGSGTDTLTGLAAGDTYSITGANAVTLTTGAMSATSIDSLIGGAGPDSFNGAGGNLSGDIADGGGATTLIGSIQTGGAQTYSGAVSAAAAVSLTSGGAISATNVANDFVNTVAATGNGIQITDANALTITLNDSGSSTINAGGNLVVSGTVTGTLNTTTTGIGTTSFGATNAGTFISNSAGAISVNGNLTGGGMISLTSGGALTQSPGALLGGTSAYLEGSKVILNEANPVGVIAGKATGNATGDIFSYTSINGIAVITVNGFAGIQTASPPDTFSVVLNAGNAGISQNAPISAGASGISLNTAGSSTINSSMNASTINLQSTGGIALGAASSLTAGGVATIVLNAGTGSFANNSSAGAAALSAPSSRWLVYAASPGVVAKGGLVSAFRHYSGTYASYPPASVTEAGNGFIYASAPGVLSVNTTLVSGTASHIYGATPTAQFGYAIGNPTIADNEDLLLIAGTPAFNPTPSSITPAGSYTVTYLSGLTSSAGYTFTPGTGLLYVIDPATLALITASLTGTASKTYDGTTTATLAPGNFLLSGFVNGDDATVTQTAGTYASPNAGSGILVSTTLAASDFSPVGTTNLANYTLPTSASGNIGLITPAPLFVAANNASKVYDAIPYSGGNNVTYSGLVNGETAIVLSGTLTYGGTSQGAVNTGSYTITPGGLTSGNYAISYVDGMLTIDPATLTLTASLTGTASKTYDGTTTAKLAPGNFLLSGFVGTDSATVTKTTGTYASPNAGSGILVSTTLVATDFSPLGSTNLANYTLPTSASGNIGLITPASLSVTANAQGKVYGSADPVLTYAASGLIGSDTLSGAQSRAAGENVGAYAITQGTLGNPNYTISYTGNNLSITPASLTVTANNASKVYDAIPYSGGNGVTYSGLANGDTAAALSGTLNYSGTSQGAMNAGDYLITPSGLTSSNYTIGYVDGTLTITPVALGLMSVTANDASKTYGDTLTFTGTEFTPVGLLGGDTISGVTLTSPGAIDTANAGIYAITPSNAVFSVGNAGNYTISYVDGQLTVNPAPLTVTADALSKAAGNPDPLLTYTTTGLKLADTTATTLGGELARLAGETAGVYPINQGTLSLLSSNYTMNYVPADFSIVAPSTVVNELVNDIIVAPPDVPFEPPASPEPAQTPAADADDEEKKDDEAASVVPDGTPASETATAAAPLPVCK